MTHSESEHHDLNYWSLLDPYFALWKCHKQIIRLIFLLSETPGPHPPEGDSRDTAFARLSFSLRPSSKSHTLCGPYTADFTHRAISTAGFQISCPIVCHKSHISSISCPFSEVRMSWWGPLTCAILRSVRPISIPPPRRLCAHSSRFIRRCHAMV